MLLHGYHQQVELYWMLLLPGAHLGEGPAEEFTEAAPLPFSASPPLMVPADITADIMALMDDNSSPPAASLASSSTPFMASAGEPSCYLSSGRPPAPVNDGPCLPFSSC